MLTSLRLEYSFLQCTAAMVEPLNIGAHLFVLCREIVTQDGHKPLINYAYNAVLYREILHETWGAGRKIFW